MADDSITIYDDDEGIAQDTENEAGGEGSVIEAQIINTVLETRSVSIITSNGLDETYFPGYEVEFKFVMGHWEKYEKVPDITTFLDRFPEFPVFDVDEAEAAMVFKIKEAKGYSLIAPALREIDEAAKENSIEAARQMRDKAEAILQEISLNRFLGGIDLFKQAEIRYSEYLRRLELKGQLGCAFGIKSFDDAVGGAWENDFVGIVGRPGQGKSWIMEYFLLHPWKYQQKSVLLFSLENPKDVVGFRADSLLEHFSNFALMTGGDVVEWQDGRPLRTAEDYKAYIAEMAKSDVPFEVLDLQDSLSGGFTIEDILEIAEQRRPDILGIDQLSLLLPSKQFRSIREQYIHITRTIRKWVNKNQIPVYLNCQAGRDASKMSGKNKDNTPELHQIAESDSVGQDATKVISIHNAEGILKVGLKKNTLGRSNLEALMAWDIDTGRLTPTSLENMESPTDQF